jgi:protocatechuate 3,4-dioxygenase beta subunit
MLLSRKTLLTSLGVAGAGLFTARCAGSAAATSAAATAATASNAACAVTPEGEIGPYFTDDSASGYDRSNILANLDGTQTQTGVPLGLTVLVRDSEKSCAAVANAQVDIWHCNASGVYSNESSENTTGEQWLRGYQITNAAGSVTFATIIPGWYQGRTTHIHLRVRSAYSEASSTSDGTNTTQVFFDQTLVDTLSTSLAPYNSEGVNPTTNASDRVYAGETRGVGLLALSGSAAAGYTATYTVDLPIT